MNYFLPPTATLILWVICASSFSQTLPVPPASPQSWSKNRYNPDDQILEINRGDISPTYIRYDRLKRPLSLTNGYSASTAQLGYNERDQIVSVEDPRGLLTRYVRDGFGEVHNLISPDSGSSTYEYEVDGKLKTVTDARGAITTNTYDVLRRLIRSVHVMAGRPTQTYQWAYDLSGTGYAYSAGRLSRIDYSTGGARFVYDSLGRVTEFVQSTAPATGANPTSILSTIRYAYNPGGKVREITYPSGRKVTFTFSSGNPVSISLSETASSTPQILIRDIEYFPFGGLYKYVAAGNPEYTSQTYLDQSGRISGYNIGRVMRHISYDAAGRIGSYRHYDAFNENPLTEYDRSFGYDRKSQLTSVVTSSTSWGYSYDQNGNRTEIRINGSPSTITPASTSNRLVSSTNPMRTFGYDLKGGTTSDTASYTATFDAGGRLSSVTRAGVTSTYNYNSFGQRTRKYTNAGPSSVVLFVYDPHGKILGEYSSTGAPIREYIWLDDRLVAFFVNDILNPANPPTAYFVYTDHLGTPRVVLDRNQRVRWRFMSEEFGTQAPEQNPSGLGAMVFPLRFPGQYADQESGLVYNFQRYYDPTLGRYTQSDPIGLAGGVNTYTYVGGNPLSYVDPTGEVGIPGAIYGGIAGGIGGYISGGWKGAVYGAGAGALVGAVNPWASHWAGGAAGAAAASLLGQGAGNYAAGKSLSDPCNYDFTAAAGAAAGGALGGPLNHAIGRYGPQIRLSEIGRSVGSQSVGRSPALTLGAAAEGAAVGSGELAGTGRCSCGR